MWFFSDIDLATSFFADGVGFLSNAYSAYMLLIYQARTIKEEARRFYIAEFGKWSIAVTMFALIFLYVDVLKPLVLVHLFFQI